MAVRGPKPKPTATKSQAGNPGHRALNTAEPHFDPALPDPPLYLTESAVIEWKRVAPQLFAARVLTAADLASLAAYCQAYADWMNARDELSASGFTITTEKGNLIQSPWVGIANKAMNNFVKIAAEFGMTPSSRTRVSALTPQKNSKLDKFRGQKS
jgi:P27 family predicted phage terminase small subunit